MIYTKQFHDLIPQKSNPDEYKGLHVFGKMSIHDYEAIEASLNHYEKDAVAVNALAAKNEELFSYLFAKGIGHASPPFDPILSNWIDTEYTVNHFDGPGLSIFIRAGGKVMDPLPKKKKSTQLLSTKTSNPFANTPSPFQWWKINSEQLDSEKEVLSIYHNECFNEDGSENTTHLETFYSHFLSPIFKKYRIQPESLRGMIEKSALPSASVLFFMQSTLFKPLTSSLFYKNLRKKVERQESISLSEMMELSQQQFHKYNKEIFQILLENHKNCCEQGQNPVETTYAQREYWDFPKISNQQEKMIFQILSSTFLDEQDSFLAIEDPAQHWKNIVELSQSKQWKDHIEFNNLNVYILNHLLDNPVVLDCASEEEIGLFVKKNKERFKSNMEIIFAKGLALKDDAPLSITRNQHFMTALIQYAESKFETRGIFNRDDEEALLEKFLWHYDCLTKNKDLASIGIQVQKQFEDECDLFTDKKNEIRDVLSNGFNSFKNFVYPSITSYWAYESLVEYQKIHAFAHQIEPRHLCPLMNNLIPKHALSHELLKKTLSLNVNPVKPNKTPSLNPLIRF